MMDDNDDNDDDEWCWITQNSKYASKRAYSLPSLSGTVWCTCIL